MLRLGQKNKAGYVNSPAEMKYSRRVIDSEGVCERERKC